jgi:dolichol-phosphate mannosyltransferase
MARISLILPLAPDVSVSAEQVGEHRRALEETGHSVEVLGVVDSGVLERPEVMDPAWRCVVSEERGLSAASFAGVRAARGAWLVILDVTRGYSPDDVRRVVEPLLDDRADLVVASRRISEALGGGTGRLSRSMGALMHRAVGSSDPLSGLVALTSDLAVETTVAPVGSHFAMELLVRADGRRCDVPTSAPRIKPARPFRLGELKQLKRLSDAKFGTLSRLFQFCVVGASGMVVDLTCYALFQALFSGTSLAQRTAPLVGGPLSLAVAAGISILIALTWNFSLNRRMTFSYARRGSIVRQYVTYALGNGVAIALSFSLRLILPAQIGFFGRHRLAAAVVGIVAATGVSFSMARWLVFSRRSAERPSAPMLGGAMAVGSERPTAV